MVSLDVTERSGGDGGLRAARPRPVRAPHPGTALRHGPANLPGQPGLPVPRRRPAAGRRPGAAVLRRAGGRGRKWRSPTRPGTSSPPISGSFGPARVRGLHPVRGDAGRGAATGWDLLPPPSSNSAPRTSGTCTTPARSCDGEAVQAQWSCMTVPLAAPAVDNLLSQIEQHGDQFMFAIAAPETCRWPEGNCRSAGPANHAVHTDHQPGRSPGMAAGRHRQQHQRQAEQAEQGHDRTGRGRRRTATGEQPQAS